MFFDKWCFILVVKKREKKLNGHNEDLIQLEVGKSMKFVVKIHSPFHSECLSYVKNVCQLGQWALQSLDDKSFENSALDEERYVFWRITSKKIMP